VNTNQPTAPSENLNEFERSIFIAPYELPYFRLLNSLTPKNSGFFLKILLFLALPLEPVITTAPI